MGEECGMPPVMFTIVGNPCDLVVSQCTFCANRSPDGTRCKAFPKGIPTDVLHNRHDHSDPYPGDSGIRYQPVQLGLGEKASAKVPSSQVSAI